jgi:hypothetical protein
MSSSEVTGKAKVRYITGRRSFKEITVTKQRVRISIFAAATMILCGLIGSGASGLAQSGSASIRQVDDEFCSNRTLRGKYAFAIEGVFVDAPVPLPLRGVALTHFDGQGNLTQVDHVVFNGTLPPIEWTPATGTYSVNRDCTGEAEIIIPGSPFSPVILRLVVGNNGTEIRTVVSKPGYVVTSTATKVDQSK